MAEIADTEEALCQRLQDAFGVERNDWKVLMEELIPKLRDAGELTEAQVLMLSHRHKLIDTVAKYRNKLAAMKASDTVYKRIQYGRHKESEMRRPTERELNEYVSADMAYKTRKAAILSAQIDFLEQTVETLDKMGFAIRNRIEIENIQSGRL
mgnify:CR=1 FL=1